MKWRSKERREKKRPNHLRPQLSARLAENCGANAKLTLVELPQNKTWEKFNRKREETGQNKKAIDFADRSRKFRGLFSVAADGMTGFFRRPRGTALIPVNLLVEICFQCAPSRILSAELKVFTVYLFLFGLNEVFMTVMSCTGLWITHRITYTSSWFPLTNYSSCKRINEKVFPT